MKKFFLTLALSLVVLSSFAQSSPQLIWQPPPSSLGQTAGGAPFDYIGGSRIQSMYKPTEFPGLTGGNIIAVYLRASTDRQNTMSFRNMTVKMCHLPVNESGPNPDTIPWSVVPRTFFPCNTVFYAQTFSIPTPIDSGDWIKFPLQTPFQYNGLANFLVEFSHDSGSLIQPIPLVNTISYKLILRTYETGCPPFTGNWYPPGVPAQMNLIGLDMAPNSVGGISDLRSMQLYPNPALDKVFLQWDAGKTVKELSVTLTNVTGAVVWQHSYAHAGTRFSESIDVSRLPRGLYLAEIKADGEKITRKLVLQ